MIYGYARCSTNESMQDIDRQIRELKQQGAEDKTIYREYESGTKTNRAELQKLLDIVKPGDTILATEVSRITRSTKQLCDIIELAKNRKIKLVTTECLFHMRGSIGDIAVKMESFGFAVPHKSFVVNLHHVKNLKGYDMFMTNGEILPLSQKKSAELREMLTRWLAQQI